MITGVAIRWGVYMIALPRPRRHSDVLALARKWVVQRPCPDDDVQFVQAFRARMSGEQGFITHTGEFLSRKPAAEHARACGQTTSVWAGAELFSEDLW